MRTPAMRTKDTTRPQSPDATSDRIGAGRHKTSDTMSNMELTRRTFGRLALAAVPVPLLAKPDSKWGGVQIGINAPYSFHGLPGSADDVQKYVLDLGLSAVELRSQPVEEFFGCPIHYGAGSNPRPSTPASPEEQEARRKDA